MKNYYFITDAHLGCRAFQHHRTQERRLVRFLDTIKEKAEAVFMLGDMFDFWFEYADVVPRGFTRFLGKVSELTDMGVEVHFFQGNHDMWCTDYLQKECGVIVHRAAHHGIGYGQSADAQAHGKDQRGQENANAFFHWLSPPFGVSAVCCTVGAAETPVSLASRPLKLRMPWL